MVVGDAADTAFVVVMGVEGRVAIGFAENFCPIYNVGMLDSIVVFLDSFTGTNAISIVGEFEPGPTCHVQQLELAALLPEHRGVPTIDTGVALLVIGDGLAIVTGQQVFPGTILSLFASKVKENSKPRLAGSEAG